MKAIDGPETSVRVLLTRRLSTLQHMFMTQKSLMGKGSNSIFLVYYYGSLSISESNTRRCHMLCLFYSNNATF